MLERPIYYHNKDDIELINDEEYFEDEYDPWYESEVFESVDKE